MSNKFTGITSAGSAIPVYDKDAHEALSSKLDTTAFSSVSGEFATVDDVVAAVSGKADTTAIPSLDGYATQEWVGEQGYLTEVPESAVSGFATHEEVESATSGAFPSSGVTPLTNDILNTATGIMVTYHGTKPDVNAAIYAGGNTLYNVNEVAGSDLHVYSSNLFLRGTIAATSGGFSANGISAGKLTNFAIQGRGETFSSTYGNGFVFESVNSGIGSARLTLASPNSVVQIYSPKFEAKNISGAGFSIEGSGAKGYDQNGNVTWDTSKPAKLIGWNNYQDTALDPRASGINGGIIATVLPDSVPLNYMISSAPYSYMNGGGLYACHPDGTTLSVDANSHSIKLVYPGLSSTAAMDPGDVSYKKYNSSTSATDTWSLTGSVQKREIECDSATSAITAIAGSAIGGGGGGGGGATYSAGANIDITDDVISGRDWTDDIVSATSGLQPSGDYYSATNPSGFMTELPASATEAIDTVTANSGTWGGSALPISAGPGIKVDLVDNTLVFSNDETVLWEGDASAFSLSEAATGFNNLQITYYPTEGGTACSTVMYVPSTATRINLFSEYIKESNDFIIEDVTKFITNDFTNYSYGAGAHAWYSTLMERQGGAGGDCFNRVTKVVGVNRIAGGN